MKLVSSSTLLMAGVSAGLHFSVLGIGYYTLSLNENVQSVQNYQPDLCSVAIISEPADSNDKNLFENSLSNYTTCKNKQTLAKPLKKLLVKSNNSTIHNFYNIKNNKLNHEQDLPRRYSQPLNRNIICTYRFEPAYPQEAQISQFEGTVLIRLTVTDKGEIACCEILKSSGYICLDKSAQTAVKQWVFKPAYNNGHAITSQIDIPIEYTLS